MTAVPEPLESWDIITEAEVRAKMSEQDCSYSRNNTMPEPDVEEAVRSNLIISDVFPIYASQLNDMSQNKKGMCYLCESIEHIDKECTVAMQKEALQTVDENLSIKYDHDECEKTDYTEQFSKMEEIYNTRSDFMPNVSDSKFRSKVSQKQNDPPPPYQAITTATVSNFVLAPVQNYQPPVPQHSQSSGVQTPLQNDMSQVMQMFQKLLQQNNDLAEKRDNNLANLIQKQSEVLEAQTAFQTEKHETEQAQRRSELVDISLIPTFDG